MNILSKHATKAGGPCVNIIHLYRSVDFPAEGGKKPGWRPLRWLHAFISSFPQQIGMKWSLIMIDGENHCPMPAGWFLCSSSHFKHHMQQLSWIQKTTFNFIPNPTIIFCFHYSGESGTVPHNCRGRRLTSTPPWHLCLNESGIEVGSETLFSENKSAALHAFLQAAELPFQNCNSCLIAVAPNLTSARISWVKSSSCSAVVTEAFFADIGQRILPGLFPSLNF